MCMNDIFAASTHKQAHMKKKILLIAFAGILGVMLYAYRSGAANNGGIDGTGASGGGGCGSCHGSGSTDGAAVELDSAGVAVTSYLPGMAYTVKIKGTNGSSTSLPKFGFQVTVVKASGAGSNPSDAGTWGTMPASVQLTTGSNSGLAETIIEQRAAITATSGTGANGTTYVESIPWTAPASGTGSVVIYGVMNEVNGNGNSSGDKYQIATHVTITEGVSSTPPAGVSIALTSGTNPTCSNTNVTFTATPVNGGTPSYQWQINGVNAGTNSATFTTSAITNGQSVTCIMTSSLSNATGNPATSNGITMTIHTAVVPTITQQGNVLTSSQASTYQWVSGGSAMSGATSQSYTYTQAGSFTVQTTDANGCRATSAATVVYPLGISAIAADAMNIYPNPTTGSIQLNITEDILGGDVRVFDFAGKLVYAGKAESENSSLNIEGAAGIYMVQLSKNGKTLTKKIVKL